MRNSLATIWLLLLCISAAMALPGTRTSAKIVSHGSQYGVDLGWQTSASSYAVPTWLGIYVGGGQSTTQRVHGNVCWWVFDVPPIDGLHARRVTAAATLETNCEFLHIPKDGSEIIVRVTTDNYKAEIRSSEQHSHKLAELTVVAVADPNSPPEPLKANDTTQSAVTTSEVGQHAVSVSSTPDGADIEVDGKFMGSTPSTIKLSTGEHAFVIHKLGYTVWRRTLTLLGGEVKLSAELERDATK